MYYLCDVTEMFLETIKACTGLMCPNPSPTPNQFLYVCKLVTLKQILIVCGLYGYISK